MYLLILRYIYICIYIYICVCVCVCMCAYIYSTLDEIVIVIGKRHSVEALDKGFGILHRAIHRIILLPSLDR